MVKYLAILISGKVVEVVRAISLNDIANHSEIYSEGLGIFVRVGLLVSHFLKLEYSHEEC